MSDNPAGEASPSSEGTNTTFEPSSLIVTYVGGVSVSSDVPNRMVLATFLTGVPLPTTPDHYETQMTVGGVYALNVRHARFLRDRLDEFLHRTTGEVDPDAANEAESS